ncbi:MAG TPA: hydroxyacylglutathione hydrolase [Thermodesulfobacteriota bacterium]|nr:hydroxyacylglutathione hydrolase [Thermodesulfobacteriota bacterium]
MDIFENEKFTILRLVIDNSDRNFNYIIWCNETRQCAVIDPLDARELLYEVRDKNLTIKYVINTHAHPDHIEGNNAIIKVSMISKILIHPDGLDYVSPRVQTINDGDTINIGNISIKVLHTPGHCTEHVSLLIDDYVFVGDTLFVCGCGNTRFRGNPNDLYKSISTKLAILPGDTKILCGHEYSENNLQFALSVDPDNTEINKKLKEISFNLERDKYPVTTIDQEKTYNPFLRLDNTRIIDTLKNNHELKSDDPESVFIKLRELRNVW